MAQAHKNDIYHQAASYRAEMLEMSEIIMIQCTWGRDVFEVKKAWQQIVSISQSDITDATVLGDM